MTGDPLLRIGALSRATGVAVSTLRSWEVRYGMPQPARTSGGHRLYPRASIGHVQDVQALIAGGASTSAAAASVLATTSRSGAGSGPIGGTIPLAALVTRSRTAIAENRRLRAELNTATAAATATLDALHHRSQQLRKANAGR